MRNFVSAIIERDSPWSGRVESEPYEGGWASEALWFVRVLDVEGEGTLELVPEISPDGMHWIAHGEPPLRIRQLAAAVRERVRGQPLPRARVPAAQGVSGLAVRAGAGLTPGG